MKKTLIAVVFLLVVSLLASCSGVKQADLDAANAAKASVQSDLVKAQADLAAASRTIAEQNMLSALHFVPEKFTSTAHKFSFRYNSTWSDATGFTLFGPLDASVIAKFGAGEWFCPQVVVSVLPKTTGATLSDVLITPAYLTATYGQSPAIGTIHADKTNFYGTKASVVTWQWGGAEEDESTDDITDAKSFGFIKGDNWYVMTVFSLNVFFGPLENAYPDDIFNTWQFTE